MYATGFCCGVWSRSRRSCPSCTVFEGAGFASLFTTMVVVIGRMLPSNLYSTGQSLAATMGFGIAPIIGAGLGGLCSIATVRRRSLRRRLAAHARRRCRGVGRAVDARAVPARTGRRARALSAVRSGSRRVGGLTYDAPRP